MDFTKRQLTVKVRLKLLSNCSTQVWWVTSGVGFGMHSEGYVQNFM